jgi:hypothetical protein
VLTLVLTAAGCGGGGDAQPVPEPASSAASPSPSGDATALFEAAVEPLLDHQVIDFTYDVYSGDALAIETRGRAYRQAGWKARTTSPKELGSSEAPTGDQIKGSMQVRAVGDDLYMQLSTWEPPLAGCWLRTGGGQVPGGQLAMTPGAPGYVTLLGALQPAAVVAQDGDRLVIGADVPLRVGLQLTTTGVLGLLQLGADQLDGTTVPVGVEVTAGVVTGVELLGSDLVDAVHSAGGDLTADAEATVGQLRIAVAYDAGPDEAPRVEAPSDDEVMTNDDVRTGRGC